MDDSHFFQILWSFTGGLNLNATKYARIAEFTGRDGALSVTLAAHQAIGLKVIHTVLHIAGCR